MDSTTFTAYSLDQHRAAQLARENEIIRSQRERDDRVLPHTRTNTGVITRLLRAVTHRRPQPVASAH